MKQKTKCSNCKHYMEIIYTNGKGGKKTHCLKLEDVLSANIIVLNCNQFESKIDLTNTNPVKV